MSEDDFYDKKDGYYRKIGRIQKATLGFNDREMVTLYLDMDYGGACQLVGGFHMALGLGENARTRPYAMEYVLGVLRACGVGAWNEVQGRTVFLLWPNSDWWNVMPVGMENLPTEPGQRFLFETPPKLAIVDGVMQLPKA